jgi:hypothetical protein
MRAIPAGLLTALLVAGPSAGAEDAEAFVPQEARLRAHVVKLASAEFAGRKGAGGRKAADYLVRCFTRLGLEPAFGGSFTQPIPGKPGEPVIGRNVGAVLRGSDPSVRDEWVIVSAHFDHLGTRNGTTFPGADDNASGVAMMLETARALAGRAEGPRRSVMFVGFDLEEVGLFGSRYFVEHSPVPLAKVGLFVTADMIGRSLGGVCDPYVFVMGTEHAPALRPWVEAAASQGPVKAGLVGSDVLVLDRSDYGPFRARKVPYLFFSTGENPRYHTPDDTAETLDFAKVEAVSRVVCAVARRAADAANLPPWADSSEPSLAEARTLRDVLGIAQRHRDDLRIGPASALLIANTIRSLDAILARGTVTPDERTAVIRFVRVILASVF